MNRENKFYSFLELLITENKLNSEESEKFIFVSFEKYAKKINKEDTFLIYEDWWLSKPDIVKSKIKSILHISERIYARKCTVKKITKPETDSFLFENHILGFTNSKIKYGLFYENSLYAVAAFAGKRQFRQGRSVELLRFCTKNGFTLTGGLDKLLQAYIRENKPDTLMTYIDLDWGSGNAFLKLGFETTEFKLPITFFVNKNTGERIPEKYFDNYEKIIDYVKVKNSGSLKIIKSISQ